VNVLYKFFRSMKLAIVLIGVIVVLSILATLVPQGMPDHVYRAQYSPALYALVTSLGLQRFFSSVLFLLPVLLFTINLGVCAADRLITRARTRAKRRYGPDLLHLGLLVLVAGGLVTALGRRETSLSLVDGQEAQAGKGYVVRLLSFQFFKYDNGMPREWISTVRVTRNGREEVISFPLKVNHPLRLPGMTLYQAAWNIAGTLTLTDTDGKEVSPQPGDYFEQEGTRWEFTAFEQSGEAWAVSFSQFKDKDLAPVQTRHLRAGDSIGPFAVKAISARQSTVLKAVSDPGLAPLLAALVLLLAGLGLTFIQKRGDSAT
jgi:cytochrome c biogenesis protein ResB